MKEIYLARYADCIFWMSRYLERAENLAALLDVTYRFSPGSSNEQNWHSLLMLHCDEEIFNERYPAITADNVARFYFCDNSHSSSIISCLNAARFNARQLRSVISTEMWIQINTLYSDLIKIANEPIEPEDLWWMLTGLRKQCQMMTGIAEGTLYRDQGWYFYLIGKYLERADQTTRLLDIKYHLLLPSVEAVGSTIDSAQWFALLRAASGYHSFWREYPYAIKPSTVAGFLLLDKRFPRSVVASINAMGEALHGLHHQFSISKAKEITALNEELLQQLKKDPISAIIRYGLHEYLDHIQLRLMHISEKIATRFFTVSDTAETSGNSKQSSAQ